MSTAEPQRPYSVANIDELPNEPYEEAPGTEWKPLRRYFGIGSFGANVARATAAGGLLTHDHTEIDDSGTRHEELFLIVAGRATFRVEGEEIDAQAGTFLYVPDPATRRGAVAVEPGTVMLALGAEPGAVFAPSDWDTDPLPD